MKYRHLHIFLFSILLAGMLLPFKTKSQNATTRAINCQNGLTVNSHNGNLYFQRNDISVKARGFTLDAIFSYNSGDAEENKGYGSGWSYSHESFYTVDSIGVTINDGKGGNDQFILIGNYYMPPKGVFDQLSEYQSGKFKLRKNNGTIYYYDNAEHQKVTKIEDRNGNFIVFSYNNNFQLANVADMSNRKIIFQYADTLMVSYEESYSQRKFFCTYDTLARLTQVSNPLGHSIKYDYNSDNRLTKITNARGDSTLIYYNQNGATVRIKTDVYEKTITYATLYNNEVEDDDIVYHYTNCTDYVNNKSIGTEYYQYNKEGLLEESSTGCCSGSTKLFYDDDKNLIKMVSANGAETHFTYDERGNMTSSTDALGYTNYVTYEPEFNKSTSYTDKNGNKTAYTYDSKGNLIRMEMPLGVTTSYTYNTYGQKTGQTDALGNTTQYEYDQLGYLNIVRNPLGHTTSFTFNQMGKLLSSADPKGNTTTFAYDILGRMIKTTNTLNHSTKFQYDKNNNTTTISDALNNQTSFSYNALNSPIKVTDALNNSVEFSFLKESLPLSVKDAMGNTTFYQYNREGQLISKQNPLNEIDQYYYDVVGNLSGTQTANTNTVSTTYDLLNRPIKAEDNLGVLFTQTFDSVGNMTSYTDAHGNTTTYKYDSLNRLIKTIDPNGNVKSYIFDKNSNLKEQITLNGLSTTFEYNEVDQLISQTDEANNTTTFTYDDNGNLYSISDGNSNQTTYQYDALNRRFLTTFANQTTQQYWYDRNNNILKYKDNNGNIKKYIYNSKNQLIQKTYPDNSKDTFSFNKNGKLLAAINPNATINYTYDNAGRRTSETLNGKTTTYNRNIANGTVAVKYPGGRAIVNIYTLRNQLSAISENNNNLTSFVYNNNNLLSGMQFQNGIITSYNYNANKQLIALLENAGALSSVQMEYDKLGNLTLIHDLLDNTQSEQFTYSVNNSLTSYKKGAVNGDQITAPNLSSIFNYDALGNRTSINNNSIQITYNSNNVNQYTSFNSSVNAVPEYDKNGNLTKLRQQNYTYNFNNQLKSINNGETARYKYDALGRRIEKTTPTDTVCFYYSYKQIIEEQSNNGNTLRTYIYGNSVDDILNMQANGQNYFYHKNRLGSVTAISDNNGNIIEKYTYTPYGEMDISNGNNMSLTESTIDNPYTFTGRRYDSESDLYYYRARTFSSELGRFMQADPLQYEDGLNLYSYVGNNPSNYIDPFGTKGTICGPISFLPDYSNNFDFPPFFNPILDESLFPKSSSPPPPLYKPDPSFLQPSDFSNLDMNYSIPENSVSQTEPTNLNEDEIPFNPLTLADNLLNNPLSSALRVGINNPVLDAVANSTRTANLDTNNPGEVTSNILGWGTGLASAAVGGPVGIGISVLGVAADATIEPMVTNFDPNNPVHLNLMIDSMH